jgi:hypothetical protein
MSARSFLTPYSMGQRRLRQEVQTDKLCLDHNGAATACVENRRWTYRNVTYVTLNVQGSCNNLCDTAPDAAGGPPATTPTSSGCSRASPRPRPGARRPSC